MKIINSLYQVNLNNKNSINQQKTNINRNHNLGNSFIKPSVNSIKANFIPFLGKNNDELSVNARKQYIKAINKMTNDGKEVLRDDEKALLITYRANKDSSDPEIRDEAYKIRDILANSSMKTLRKLIKPYEQNALNTEYSEVFNEGLLALYEYFDNVDLSKPNTTPVFAIKERLKKFNSMIQGPVTLNKSDLDRIHTLKKTTAILTKEFNRPPTLEEVTERFKNARSAQSLRSRLSQTIYADSFENSDDSTVFSKNPDFEKKYADKEASKVVLDHLKKLNPKHQDIILLVAGLELTNEGELIDIDIDKPKETLAVKYSSTPNSIDRSHEFYRRKIRGELSEKIPDYFANTKILTTKDDDTQKAALPDIFLSIKDNKATEILTLQVKDSILKSKTLNAKEKNMLFLRYFNGGNSFKEIAEATGLANKSMAQKAIIKIITKLEKSEDFPSLDCLL